MFLRILVVSFWILTLLQPAPAQISRRRAGKPGSAKPPATSTATVQETETDSTKPTLRQSEQKGWVWVSHTIDLAQQLGGEDNIMTLDGGPLPVMLKRRITLGLVIDNENHVVTRLVDVTPTNKPLKVTVRALGGRPVGAKFLGMDAVTGLCVLKADEGVSLTPPAFYDSPALPNRLNIRLYGFHPNLNQNTTASMTQESPRRDYYQGQIAKAVEDFRFNTGNPIYYLLSPQLTTAQDCSLILNKDNSVFGLTIYNIGSEGKHLVYPISRVQAIAKSVIKDEKNLAFGWLGASGSDVYASISIPSLMDKKPAPAELGVRINNIAPDSPAEKAGVKPGDIVVAVNDRKVDTQAQMVTMMRQIPADNEVTLKVRRNREYRTLKARLIPAPGAGLEQQLIAFNTTIQNYENELKTLPASHPNRPNIETRQQGWKKFVEGLLTASPPDVRLRVYYGLEVQSLTGQLMNYFAASNGILVSTVNENSMASRSGLQAGDVIVKVGEKSVNSLPSLIGALDAAAGAPVEIAVSRRREQIKITFQH